MKNSKKHKTSDIWKEDINFDFCWNYSSDDGGSSLNDHQYKDLIMKNYAYHPELHGFKTNKDDKDTNSY